MIEKVERASSIFRYLCAALVLSLIATTICSILFGVTNYSPSDLLRDAHAREIVFRLRLPRIICALLVGAALSVVGVAYQALFRNYLASPFTLGISSGAALFASAALIFGLTSTSAGSIDISVFAFIGALVSIFLILSVSAGRSGGDRNSLLLVGVVFSFFCSSLMTLLQYLADYSRLFQITRWMMGGIPSVGWGDLTIGAITLSVILAWLLPRTRELDLILFGDDLATVKGVDVRRFSQATFILSSFLVGWVVANCGVIGFVGIIVPALARIIVGIRHSRVIPISIMLGALLVLICDLLGRVVIAPFEVPAGVFTAVLGGPIFMALLVYGSGRIICNYDN